MEFFIRKLQQSDLPSVPNLLRVVASPATVKLHKGVCTAVLCQEGNQIGVVGLCVGRVKILSLVMPEATPAPAVGTHLRDTWQQELVPNCL